MDTKQFTLEPATQKFLDALNKSKGLPLYEMTVVQAREFLTDAQKVIPSLRPADIEERMLSNFSIRIVRPKDTHEQLPCVLYFHGGGWVLGDSTTHDYLVREIAHGAQAAVIFVSYTRSPEAQYPQALEQAYEALEYCVQHSKELRIDTSRLAVAGDSAGATLATVLALLAKERKGPDIACQVLFYPVTDAGLATQSYKDFGSGYYLTAKAMQWFWDNYAPDKNKRRESHCSPLQASEEQLRGVPPALIITGECDVLRDEGEAYGHKLMQAGISVTAVRFLGTVHDFVMLHALAETPAARAARQLAISCLRNAWSER